MDPLVSVIIPTYNSANYIEGAIDSVLSQEYKNIEIIVIDDGSTDNTDEILRRYENRIYYIKKENGGPASARNQGLAQAKGDFIAFLDADDIWLKDKLKIQIGEMRDGVGITGTAQHAMSQKKEISWFVSWQDMLVRNQFSNSSVVVRKECFRDLGTFDENARMKAVEDWDMWLRILRKYKGKFINKQIVNIRCTQNSLSAPSQAKRMLDNEIGVLQKHLDGLPRSLGNFFLKAKATSYRYFCAAWAYYEDKSKKEAVKCMWRSILFFPFILANKGRMVLFLRVLFK